MKCIGQQLSRNPDTIRAHFKRQNLIVKGAVSAKYRCDAEEPVYDNAGTPRADFVSLKGANAPRNR